jgi:hypothetical protein
MIDAGLSVTRVAKILRTKAAKILYCRDLAEFRQVLWLHRSSRIMAPGKTRPRVLIGAGHGPGMDGTAFHDSRSGVTAGRATRRLTVMPP